MKRNYFKLLLCAILCAVCFSSCGTIHAILDPWGHPVYGPAPPPPPRHYHRPAPPPPSYHGHRHWSSIDKQANESNFGYELASVDDTRLEDIG